MASAAVLPAIEIVRIDATVTRPGGRRFGTLVHSVLASTPLDADRATLDALAARHGRLIGASAEEISAAAVAVSSALAHPLLGHAVCDPLGDEMERTTRSSAHLQIHVYPGVAQELCRTRSRTESSRYVLVTATVSAALFRKSP